MPAEDRSVADYYVNKNAQDNGDNEVHKNPCGWMPQAANRIYLGAFDKCEDAVAAAKRLYPKTANGCIHCSKACHTT